MHFRQEQITYSPSDLTAFMGSSFESWMDHFELLFKGRVKRDPEDESAGILQKYGDRHEASFVEVLRLEGRDIVEIEKTDHDLEDTVAAMKAGREIIFQGVLALGEFRGRTDFLVRVDGASSLGDHHYEVWDTKLARSAKPYFVTQLCCYAEMLESIQGRLPETVTIVLGNYERVAFRTKDYIYQFRQFKESFLDFHRKFSAEDPPEDCTVGPFTKWQTESDRYLDGRDDLIRVANIRRSQIVKLKEAGIHSLKALATSDLQSVSKLKQETFEAMRHQAKLQLATRECGTTVYEPLPEQAGIGLTQLPPRSVNDVFFDMEGYPLIEDGLEYLFGATVLENGEMRFHDWWAHSRAEEKSAFESFIDWVYARWQADPGMHVYHYAAYEVSAVKRLAGRHATRIEEVDNLLRGHVFVDLYRITKQAIRVGEPSYSIKYVEHLYKEKRKGNVAKAADSVVFYDRWLELHDGDDWRSSKILREIRDYNEEDCVSTLMLADWLAKRQSELSIAFSGKIVDSAPEAKPKDASALLETAMLEEAEDISDPEQQRVHKLIAYLLQYHKREDKPLWWKYFEHRAMTDEELFDDIDCIAGLGLTSKPPTPIAKSRIFEYSFDPTQETKISAKDNCIIIEQFSDEALKSRDIKIHDIDRKLGVATFKIGNKGPALPQKFSLAKHEVISAGVLVESLYKIASAWSKDKILTPALATLLFRSEPKIAGRAQGTPIAPRSSTDEVTKAICNMQDTTLCIQGPPGCGKTHNASYAILALLKEGKRVGVTSNSHKAIENLLAGIAEAASEEGVSFKGAKINGSEPQLDRGYMSTGQFNHFKDLGAFSKDDSIDDFQIIGGTAWCFAREEFKGTLDYLFVDEAGQVCLANLVAMSSSTKNIVLLGDQMQLEQPSQGTHPEESGQSALEYLLQDSATVPDEFGIFLRSTFRMHSELCSVISSAVYDDKLKPVADNNKQVLIVPPSVKESIPKEAGVVFVPTSHKGNSQSSEEEVAAIKNLVDKLLQCEFVDKKKGPRKVTKDDILIVCPYNLQVRAIDDVISDALVASVDKFQGWQRPIVILSMCSSEGDASPRGMDFLFSKSRLNVAISRATTMAFIVGSPALLQSHCSSIEQMHLLNFFCHLVESSSNEVADENTNRLTGDSRPLVSC